MTLREQAIKAIVDKDVADGDERWSNDTDAIAQLMVEFASPYREGLANIRHKMEKGTVNRSAEHLKKWEIFIMTTCNTLLEEEVESDAV